LFRPGSLEKAPQTFVAALNGPGSEKERSRFQRDLVDHFPNITVVDVADILQGVRRILRNITLAVSFIGGFVLFSGALILIGSIAMTKYQRIYESAVLKTLGAKRNVILRILALEYGLLGSVAGFLGSLAGLALSYIVSKFLLEIPWIYTLAPHFLAIFGTGIFVTLVGAIASLDVLRRKPLGILRTQ
jgi:putative ABC transport system permease protein